MKCFKILNMKNNKITIDIVKFNHWLNVRKITIDQLIKKKNSLRNKIKKSKNFILNKNEIDFVLNYLKISKESICLEKNYLDIYFGIEKKLRKLRDL